MPADVIADRPAHEGIWRRALRDTGRAAHSPWFVGIEVVGGGICAAIGALILADASATALEVVLVTGFSGVVGLLLSLFVVFLAQLGRAPFRQRNEARHEIVPGFPRHALEIDPPWYVDLDGEDGKQERMILLPLTYTNREPEQRVSLEFQVMWVQLFHHVGRELGPYEVRPYRRRKIPDVITSPTSIEPQTTLKGQLQLNAEYEFAFDFDEELWGVHAKPDFRIYLRVTDLVSGGLLEQDLPPSKRRIAGTGTVTGGTGNKEDGAAEEGTSAEADHEAE